MKSKLQTTIAELSKLKNQMRLELDQIRPNRHPIVFQKKDIPGKRLFIRQQFPTTDIIHPPREKQISKHKKLFSASSIRHQDTNKSAQKKHFYKQYQNTVSLDNSVKKRTSSYFNIKVDLHNQSVNASTSLYGVGLHDKSHSPISARSGIKIYPQKFMRKGLF